jgi:hypothetical protein
MAVMTGEQELHYIHTAVHWITQWPHFSVYNISSTSAKNNVR